MLFLDVEGTQEQIRKAIIQRLGVGNWKIFGAHGAPKDYCVK